MDNQQAVILARLDAREKSAVPVQEVLTEWGSIIRTRIGINEDKPAEHRLSGLIILELTGKQDQQRALEQQLNKIKGVAAKLVPFP